MARRRPPDAVLAVLCVLLLALPAASTLGLTTVGGFQMFSRPHRYRLSIDIDPDGEAQRFDLRALRGHVGRDATRVLTGADRFTLGETQAELLPGALPEIGAHVCTRTDVARTVTLRLERRDLAGRDLPTVSHVHSCR